MRKLSLFLVLSTLFLCPLVHAESPGFAGTWIIDPGSSSAIDPWRRITLEIGVDGDDLTIVRTVSTGRRTHTNTYPMKIGETVFADMGWWTGNRHIGAYMDRDKKGKIRADWLDNGSVLRVESKFVLISSQGRTKVRSYEEYRLSADGDELTVIQLRSSRNKPIVHVFHRQQ